MSETANETQRQFWNSGFGEKWVTFETELETLHGQMTKPLLDRAEIARGCRSLMSAAAAGR